MIQCNTVNVSLWNSQLNKLKSATKYTTDVTLWLSSNIFSDDETNFSHKLLLAGSQHKIFQNTTIQNNTIWRILFQTPWTITKSWFTIDEECTKAVSQKCADTITKIDNSSLRIRWRNSWKISGSGSTTLVTSKKKKKKWKTLQK